jgi:hypothetical protein
MKIRTALLVVAAFAAAFGICLALCRWGAGGNPDLETVVREARREDDLERPLEVRRRRHEAKRALAAEVVAGRMTLREAADHFRRLDEANSDFFAHVLPPPRDERFYCERVLDTAWGVLADQQRFAEAARGVSETISGSQR